MNHPCFVGRLCLGDIHGGPIAARAHVSPHRANEVGAEHFRALRIPQQVGHGQAGMVTAAPEKGRVPVAQFTQKVIERHCCIQRTRPASSRYVERIVEEKLLRVKEASETTGRTSAIVSTAGHVVTTSHCCLLLLPAMAAGKFPPRLLIEQPRYAPGSRLRRRARPPIRPREACNLRSHRIQFNVRQGLKFVPLVERTRIEPPLPKVSRPPDFVGLPMLAGREAEGCRKTGHLQPSAYSPNQIPLPLVWIPHSL